MKNRMLSIMLVLILCLSMMPVGVFASEGTPLSGTLTVTTETPVELENVVRNYAFGWAFVEEEPEYDTITAEFTSDLEGLVQGEDYELVWMIDGEEIMWDEQGDIYVDGYNYIGWIDGNSYVPDIDTEEAVTVSVKAVGIGDYTGEVEGDAEILVAVAPGNAENVEIEVGDEEIIVNWEDSTTGGGVELTGYVVEISDENDVLEEKIATVSAVGMPLEQTFTGLENDMQYNVTVYTVNEAGILSNGSGTIGIPVAEETTTPGAVEIYYTESGVGSISLAWLPPENDGGAKIRYYTLIASCEGMDYEEIAVVDPDTHYYTFDNLNGGVVYEVSVAAVNARGEGEYSTVLCDETLMYKVQIGGVTVEGDLFDGDDDDWVYLMNDEDGNVTREGADDSNYTIKVAFGKETEIHLKDATIHNPAGAGIYAEYVNLLISGEDTEAEGANDISAVTYEGDPDEDEYLSGYGIWVEGSGSYDEEVGFEDGNLCIEGQIGTITADADGIFLSAGSLMIDGVIGDITTETDGIYVHGDVSVLGEIGNIMSNGFDGLVSASGDIWINGTVGDITGYNGLRTGDGNIYVSYGTIGDITAECIGIEAYGMEVEEDEDSYMSGGYIEIVGSIGKIDADLMGIHAVDMIRLDESDLEIVTNEDYGIAMAAKNYLTLWNVDFVVPEQPVLSKTELDLYDELYDTVFDGEGNILSAVTLTSGEPIVDYVLFEEDGVHTQEVYNEGTAFEPDAPKRSGYKFKGWYVDEDCTEAYDFDTPVTENVVLYAKWVKKSSSSGSSSKPAEPTPEVPEVPEVPVIGEAKKFDDVHGAGHWAEAAVDYVVSRGIFNGTGETTFHPDKAMTRAMAVGILYNLEGKPEVSAEVKFSDVKTGAWYVSAVNWAAEKSIVSGYNDGTYGVDKNVTREQLAVILWNYAGKPESTKDLSGYADADQISGYAKQAMAWTNEMGIINGMKNETLNPGGAATRAQVAQMMMNYLGK